MSFRIDALPPPTASSTGQNPTNHQHAAQPQARPGGHRSSSTARLDAHPRPPLVRRVSVRCGGWCDQFHPRRGQNQPAARIRSSPLQPQASPSPHVTYNARSTATQLALDHAQTYPLHHPEKQPQRRAQRVHAKPQAITTPRPHTRRRARINASSTAPPLDARSEQHRTRPGQTATPKPATPATLQSATPNPVASAAAQANHQTQRQKDT